MVASGLLNSVVTHVVRVHVPSQAWWPKWQGLADTHDLVPLRKACNAPILVVVVVNRSGYSRSLELHPCEIPTI